MDTDQNSNYKIGRIENLIVITFCEGQKIKINLCYEAYKRVLTNQRFDQKRFGQIIGLQQEQGAHEEKSVDLRMAEGRVIGSDRTNGRGWIVEKRQLVNSTLGEERAAPANQSKA